MSLLPIQLANAYREHGRSTSWPFIVEGDVGKRLGRTTFVCPEVGLVRMLPVVPDFVYHLVESQ